MGRRFDIKETKRNETYGRVKNHIRTRIRFSLLKSVLISIRGISIIVMNGEPYQNKIEVLLVEEHSDCYS